VPGIGVLAVDPKGWWPITDLFQTIPRKLISFHPKAYIDDVVFSLMVAGVGVQ
jgi:hypothetical protein